MHGLAQLLMGKISPRMVSQSLSDVSESQVEKLKQEMCYILHWNNWSWSESFFGCSAVNG